MNYRKYFLTGQIKFLVSFEKATDAQIYNKIQRILYEADIKYRDKFDESLYEGDNLKILYENNLQFQILLKVSTRSLSLMMELDEIYRMLDDLYHHV